MGVWTVLLMMSAGFSFLTQGWPKIYRTPPIDPSLRLGYFINKPSRSILISWESSTCGGKSIY